LKAPPGTGTTPDAALHTPMEIEDIVEPRRPWFPEDEALCWEQPESVPFSDGIGVHKLISTTIILRKRVPADVRKVVKAAELYQRITDLQAGRVPRRHKKLTGTYRSLPKVTTEIFCDVVVTCEGAVLSNERFKDLQNALNPVGAILADEGYAPTLFPLLFKDTRHNPVTFPLKLANSEARPFLGGYVGRPDAKTKQATARITILLGMIGDENDAITLLDDCGIKLYPAALQLQGTDPVVWISFSIKEMEQFINKEPEFNPDDTSTIASGKDETDDDDYDDDDDDEDHLPMPMNWRAAFEKVLH
jgi:hypothetical protein